jgi:hypothetical protein
VVLGRLVHDIAQAKCVQPARDEAEVIDGLTAVGLCHPFASQAEIRPTPRMTPMPSRGCGMSDVKVRLFFPSLMCHAAMLQTMDSTDGDGKPRQSFRYVFGLISRPYRIIVTI